MNSSAAFSGQYRLISSAIITCLLYLTLAELPLKVKPKRQLLTIMVIGSIALSSVFVFRGARYNTQHRAELEAGISKWPITDEGLNYPTNGPCRGHADAILKKSVNNGVYKL